MDILYELFKIKDMSIILLWYFSFYLGLSLEETLNITIENILFLKKNYILLGIKK